MSQSVSQSVSVFLTLRGIIEHDGEAVRRHILGEDVRPQLVYAEFLLGVIHTTLEASDG